MAFLGNLRITTITYVGNAALAGLAIACAAAALTATREIGTSLAYSEENIVPSLVDLDEIATNAYSERLTAAKMLLAKDEGARRSFAAKLEAGAAQIDRELVAYRTMISDAKEQGEYDDVVAQWQSWKKEALEIDRLSAGNHYAAVDAFDGKLSDIGPKLAAALTTEIGYNKEMSDVAAVAGKQLVARSASLAIGLIVAAMVTALAVIAMFLHRVVRPLARLTGAMSDMAGGDLDRDVPGREMTDEVGDIGRALLAIKRSVAERSQREAEQQMEVQRRIVAALGEGLAALKAGTLGATIEQAFPGEYERLRSDFNDALTTLAQLMGQVTAAAGSVRSGASEISAAASDLAYRTEGQAASLEESAAAVRELTASVTSATHTASQAAMLARGAQGNATTGGEIMGRAVEAMNQIAQSSRRMEEIVGLIEGIAFQTNLLALNAGVEAARAGEAGKGFAVVATEVRALAQRSAEAAKDITGIIQSSGRDVATGVEMISQTQASLDQIVTGTAELAALIDEMAVATKEQAAAIVQVDSVMTEMDRMTQQNAALVEQSTAASRSLATEAVTLGGLVEKFDLSSGRSRPETRLAA